MLSRFSVAFLSIALVVLAGLQYHWIGQVTDAERLRLQRTVRDVADDFADDFRGELRSLLGSLELRPGGPTEPTRLAFRYHTWVAAAMYPRLLRSLHYSSPEGLYRLDTDLGTMESAAWSLPFESVSAFLEYQTQFSQSRRMLRPPPRIEDVDAFLIPIGRPPEFTRESRDYRGGRGGAANPRPITDRWVVVELDRDVIIKEIFAGIAAGQPEEEAQSFRLAVVAGDESRPRALFTTGGAWSEKDLNSPDYAVTLLGQGGEFGRGRGGDMRRDPRDPDSRDVDDLDRSAVGRDGRYGIGGPLVFPAGLQEWRVLVKHEAGSLGDATDRFRRRNLAISFGVLVVLGIGAATVMLSGQRAKRLGRLQMEFAAGVSHELRTPLSVIQSAAHNLGTGVVRDPQGIEEYAAIVQKEARRLSEMVEQIMTYTETQSGRKRYDVGPVEVRDVVERAISNTMISGEAAQVTTKLDAELPMVLADAPTLIRCVQNLLSNAAKYGGLQGKAHIEVEAHYDRAAKSVQVVVTDRGPGVPAADVSHLFQAFHRGSNATTTTPGNGLGLHLVQKMMEAQKGSVRYEPAPEGGSRFILTLPAVDIVYDTA
jgi:signal transduction histidine kinase